MNFNPFWYWDDLSDQGKVKQRQYEENLGHASNVPHMEKESKKSGGPVPPTECQPEAASISTRKSWKWNGGWSKRVCDRPAVGAEGKSYPQDRDIFKSTLAKMDWERDDVLHYVVLAGYLDAEVLVYALWQVVSFASVTNCWSYWPHMVLKYKWNEVGGLQSGWGWGSRWNCILLAILEICSTQIFWIGHTKECILNIV